MRSDNLEKRDIIWNTLGSVTYAAVSFLLSAIIIVMAGETIGGIFSFGLSTFSHLVFIVSYYGIRPMHIVDIRYRYSFLDYRNFGIYTSAVAVIAGLLYIAHMRFIGNYNDLKVILLSILVLHGAIDGFADYYECEYQRVNKLYMGGQSQFFRITLFTVVLIASYYYTQNLVYAEIFAVVAEIIIFYLLNISRSKNIYKSAKLHDGKETRRNLFLESTPLFILVFLDMVIFSISKFFIDADLGDIANGFFNLIFMPTNLIYLILNLFMKPFLTPLSNAYYNNKKEYRTLIGKALLVAILLSIVFIIGTMFCGKFYIEFLRLMTGNAYGSFDSVAFNTLLVIIIGGCLYTVNSPLYYALIIEKKQKYMAILYIIITIISIFVTKIFVDNLGFFGSGVAFATNMFLICLGIIIVKALTA